MKITVKKAVYNEIMKSEYIKRWRQGNKYRYKYLPNKEKRKNIFNPYDKEKTISLKAYKTLSQKQIAKLKIISDEEFSDCVDYLLANNYKELPNIIRLPNFKGNLAKKMHLSNTTAFLTKGGFTHFRPSRKAVYGQALRIDELKQIPNVIRNTKKVYIDSHESNFLIVFIDKKDNSKINKIVFNRDLKGNYIVTAGKVDKRDLKKYTEIRAGVAPAIPSLHKGGLPITAFSESLSLAPKKNIPQSTKKSIKKSFSEQVEKLYKAMIS